MSIATSIYPPGNSLKIVLKSSNKWLICLRRVSVFFGKNQVRRLKFQTTRPLLRYTSNSMYSKWRFEWVCWNVPRRVLSWKIYWDVLYLLLFTHYSNIQNTLISIFLFIVQLSANGVKSLHNQNFYCKLKQYPSYSTQCQML